MATDLELHRDHCRKMATAQHKPECCRCGKPYCCGCLRHPPAHPGWSWAVEAWAMHAVTCPGSPSAPPCPGCVSDAERVLWARLADEVDAYLTTDDSALWEDA